MMQKQKRPAEITVIATVALIAGLIQFFVGLALTTSFVTMSDLGVDISGIETATVDSISLYGGVFHLALAAFCFFTVLSTLLRLRCAWISNKLLSMAIYFTGFLAYQSANYVDGTIAVVISTVIISLIYTGSVKEYLRKLDRS